VGFRHAKQVESLRIIWRGEYNVTADARGKVEPFRL